MAEDAEYAANEAIKSYCEEDGYPEEMTEICWGEVKQSARMTNKRDAPEGSDFDYLCDYKLFNESGPSALVPSNPERSEDARDGRSAESRCSTAGDV